jgi:hypothetical protein
MATGASVRFVPLADDALVWRPPYMNAFANTVASQIASLFMPDPNPIIVVQDEDLHCGSVNEEPARN